MAEEEQRVFNARYELHRRIARGGMADVFLARDALLDRPVAVKVLFPEFATDPTFVQRFRREAQAAANLSHPNIVSVYDWGEEGGTYFIVMEYIEGRSLAQIIKDEGRLHPDRAADITADAAAALGFAHRNGVVHRDVKPGNVLIDVNGNVKVADFGIARAANARENLTQTGAVMGTATYFSPEQAQGFGVDPRSDVYSLGVVLYEMVTGRPPFDGDSPVSIAYKHVREQPVPPSELNPSLPPAFEAIILQAMAKDPSDRYASAEELRADLLRYTQGRTVVAAPPTMAPRPTQAVSTTVVEPDGTRAMPAAAVEPVPATRRRTGAYVLLMFALLAALLGVLFLLGQGLGFFNTGGGGTIPVPSVIGRPVEEATQILRDLD
ncbi:MAG: Stk1 family PASTA domain-containing Ser/Thr kinase, partial [Actinomycetota bacterium]|nr:Stk1 family PASTA domain-containing Ser/Thr kinase [Actinomycetota bacterium]